MIRSSHRKCFQMDLGQKKEHVDIDKEPCMAGMNNTEDTEAPCKYSYFE